MNRKVKLADPCLVYDLPDLCWASLEQRSGQPLESAEIPLSQAPEALGAVGMGARGGVLEGCRARYGCFHQLGVPFCGRSYNHSLTIWGPYSVPLILEIAIDVGAHTYMYMYI